jgi:MFS family permease
LVQSVAVGWQLYSITHQPLALGLAGLAQFIPIFLLTLPAGELCDRIGPKRVLAASLVLEGVCGAVFLWMTLAHVGIAWPFFATLGLFGVARSLYEPSVQSVLPFLVPREALPRSIALNSSLMEAAIISGPALGGVAYTLSPELPYVICVAASLIAALGVLPLGGRRVEREDTAPLAGRIARVVEGLRFVQKRPVLLGAISLDLFAVLLGGATALLPIYARDILNVGPIGLGVLRSAPAAGAIVTALFLAHRGLTQRIGSRLFVAVAMFGVATIAFGLSHNVVLSVIALVVAGASDQISMYIRASLAQLATPDSMRGRVNAVYMVFVGASNELGAFESGVAAALLGTIASVVLGGVGTIVVAGLWMKLFPALRNIDSMQEVQELTEPPTER